MSSGDEPSGVRIGNVSGGIHGSVIAGGSVSNAVVTIGGRPTSVDKQPDVEELKLLLAELQRELEAFSADATLKQVSAATPFLAKGAAQTVTEAAAQVTRDMSTGTVDAVRKNLTEATTLLSMIVDGAKAVGPIVEKAAPLLERVGVAGLWLARLWA
jgi:hypothetical protein